MGAITDVQIRHWVKAALPVAKSDGDGLTFTLSAGGTAAWVLRYRMGGKPREKTIGRWPDISLKRARELATEDRAKVQQGTDVARVKQTNKRASISAWTVKQLVANYEELVLPGLAASTGVAFKQKARDYVQPVIGHLAARDVIGADVVQLLERTRTKSPLLVKSVLSVVNILFTHGLAKHVVTSNPAVGVTASAIAGRAGKSEPARIMLSDAELRVLLPALKGYDRTIDLITRILLNTGVRIQALMLAEWDHIDFEKQEWTIPKGDGRKSDRELVVPLTEALCGYFMELRTFAGECRFVFPVQKRGRGRGGDRPKPPGSVNHSFDQICTALVGKVRPFSPHDLRSTFRSHLGALEVDVVVAERCLNHKLGGLLAVYNLHDYLPERRAALELWGAKLAFLESGADNIVMLRGAA